MEVRKQMQRVAFPGPACISQRVAANECFSDGATGWKTAAAVLL